MIDKAGSIKSENSRVKLKKNSKKGIKAKA